MKKKLAVRLALVVVTLGLGAASYVALAMPSPGVCTYYSTNKYKVVVGQRGTGCCGEFINWGVTSAYRKCEQMWCLDVVCPDPTE